MDYIQYMADRYSDDSLYKLIPIHLQKALKNYNFTTDTWSNGRTMRDAFNMFSNTLYNLTPIFKLLTYADSEHKPVRIKAAYETYTAESYVGSVTSIVPYSEYINTYNIFIKHIPKGTTFITDTLNSAEENGILKRMKNVELQLINDGRHFIRVYHYPDHPNSYAILTNWIDTEFLHKLMLLIPVIIGWKFYSEEELKAVDADKQTQYILENYITHIFTNLYEYYKQDITLETFIDNVLEIFNTIVNLKGLDKLSFENFTNNLANVINNKLHSAVKKDLDNTLARIKNYEEDLEPLYSKKQMLTKQLLLIEKAIPEDVQPLIDTLKITKAMEIIDADDYELKVRVTAPLQFFDTSDFKRYQQNARSYYRDNLDNGYYGEAEIVGPIFDKIFVKHEYKLLLQSVVSLKAETSNFNADSLYVYTNTYSYTGAEAQYNQLPNPHHYYYNCWDKTKQQIRKAVTEGNYDLIPTLIVNSVQTVNVAETTSFFKLLRDLTEDRWRKKTHLITKDGTTITWQEAVEIEKANYKSMSEPVEETPEEPEVTETIDETTAEEDIPETFVDTIEHTRDQLRAAINAQAAQPGQYTQVVIEEGEATEEDLEI